MSVIDELVSIRTDILDASKGQDGFIDEQKMLDEILPLMLDAKLVDSEDYNEAYFIRPTEGIKLNGYSVTETQERLKIFIIDEDFVKESMETEDLLISTRDKYDSQFKRAFNFIQLAIQGNLLQKIQDADPVKALADKLSTPKGIDQFDVIEIFLITLSGTVSRRGKELDLRSMRFDDKEFSTRPKVKGSIHQKTTLLKKRVIDLNFINEYNNSRGHREPLEIDFQRDFDTKIEIIEAAKGENFSSYLCVLSADILYKLYRLHSSRLLEKNVRSFLQFKVEANKGIRETIRENPEKFIAYNNGLTITATKARLVASKKKTYLEALTDFQIVNGGQTTAALYFSKNDGFDISKIKVMAKINVVEGEDEDELNDLISNISRFSNTQSKVSSADLRSRNPKLRAIKSLSDSTMTPSGNKWFFERVKGEFNTSLRMAGGQHKTSRKNKYPPDRRFSKEQLAKYYISWGDKPYIVKKGGEAVFRYFIEAISPEEAPSVKIDQVFYEEMISKIILFRQMEKIYGSGKNAIGQIRAAAIPYVISSIYQASDGKKDGWKFNLGKIWKDEGLSDHLKVYLKNLLELVNDLIKKYSQSDDFGEYSKKSELWDAISASKELKMFMSSADSQKILSHYLCKSEENL